MQLSLSVYHNTIINTYENFIKECHKSLAIVLDTSASKPCEKKYCIYTLVILVPLFYFLLSIFDDIAKALVRKFSFAIRNANNLDLYFCEQNPRRQDCCKSSSLLVHYRSLSYHLAENKVYLILLTRVWAHVHSLLRWLGIAPVTQDQNYPVRWVAFEASGFNETSAYLTQKLNTNNYTSFFLKSERDPKL